jgi:hypothetical protein
VKDAFDWSKMVSAEVGELADEPQVVAVEFYDRELVEMMAEQAKVMEKSEAADHCISFCSIGPRIESRKGAATVDKATAKKRVGNDPASGSDIFVCASVAEKEEGIGVQEDLVELVGRSRVKVDPLEEHCIVVWEGGDIVTKFEVKRDGFFQVVYDRSSIGSKPAVWADKGIDWNGVVG